jgi:hypothetical protein
VIGPLKIGWRFLIADDPMAQNYPTKMQIDVPSNLARRGLESCNDRPQKRPSANQVLETSGDASLWRSTARD